MSMFRSSTSPWRCLAASLLLLAGSVATTAFGAESETSPVTSVRLYAIDCGHLSIRDMAMFSDTGEFDGQQGEMAVPCFLIRHPKGDLIWDTGLGDHLTGQKLDALYAPIGAKATIDTPLTSQLSKLNLTPNDIEFLSFSRLHLDHVGNSPLFKHSTWLLNRKEVTWATTDRSAVGIVPDLFSGYRDAKVEWLGDDDQDVFGDGRVRILRTPGHTAGHASLMLQLANAGTVILSGDLYHTQLNHAKHLVPPYNYNRAETLASFDRIEKLLTNRRARLVIEHSVEDFEALPKFPAYLD
jgi:glyoxylase-like metal-dependent hydrolase (beta-lactamase superfamily II)